MIKHTASHVDHVPAVVVEHVLDRFKDKEAFFIETFELPESLPTLDNALYGPMCGDDSVPESEVRYEPRPGRSNNSRLVDRPIRQTRTVTVIGGAHDGQPCVLFTVFGGPCSPKEPTDPYLKPEEVEKSKEFWAEHALAQPK